MRAAGAAGGTGAAGEVTRRVVLPLAPGLSARVVAARVPVQPDGTLRARLKVVAGQALLSLLVTARV